MLRTTPLEYHMLRTRIFIAPCYENLISEYHHVEDKASSKQINELILIDNQGPGPRASFWLAMSHEPGAMRFKPEALATNHSPLIIDQLFD